MPTMTAPGYTFHAYTADQAWGKFCEQRFGSLKPNRKEWAVVEIESEDENAKRIGLLNWSIRFIIKITLADLQLLRMILEARTFAEHHQNFAMTRVVFSTLDEAKRQFFKTLCQDAPLPNIRFAAAIDTLTDRPYNINNLQADIVANADWSGLIAVRFI